MARIFNRMRLVYNSTFFSSCNSSSQSNFIDQAHSFWSKTKSNPTVFFSQPESFVLQVWIKLSAGFNIGVGNFVSADGAFSSDLTNTCHGLSCINPLKNGSAKKRLFYETPSPNHLISFRSMSKALLAAKMMFLPLFFPN